MVREFKLPDVGEGVAEGELLEWHVEPGDAVTEDQVVAEVETDKAVVDVPSPVDGTVRELRAEPGDVVPVGTVIITFDVEGEASGDASKASGGPQAGEAAEASEDAETTAESSVNGQGGRVFAAPSARRLARELGVDIAAVDGSGPGGRVTEADVRAAAEDDADDGKELKSAVSRIDDSDDGETSDASDESSGGSGLKSAVSRIDDGESEPTSSGESTQAVEAAGRETTLAAPATRTVADELGVDIHDVPTDEMRDGQPYVDEAAVREYAEAQKQAQAADAEALATAESAGSAADAEAAGGAADAEATGGAVESDTATTADAVETVEGERREPYSGVRKTIGQAMERSKFTAPHVTHHDKVDATALVEAREKLKDRAEARGVKLTYVPFVMKAVAAALDEHPILNTQLDEENEEIVFREAHNIGVATATDAGLMVPVVDDIDGKGLLQLASETNELVSKARERSIAREEMQDGTFTITNFGAIGGEYATPIINYPETAILGLGAIEERPMAVDGEVVARDVLTLSLSIDHRVVDGADAARFVNTLKEYLEDPTLLLL